MHPAHPVEEVLVLEQRPDPAPARDHQDVAGPDGLVARRNIDRQRAKHIGDPPGFGCDETDLRTGNMGQDLVRSDRVERLEAIEEQDHNIHAPHLNWPTIRQARQSGCPQHHRQRASSTGANCHTRLTASGKQG
jgi:predicted metal-dependent phosphoesterase TrpH